MAAETSPSQDHKAPFSELFRDGRAFSTILVVLSAVIQALQVLVIAIIMPMPRGIISAPAETTG